MEDTPQYKHIHQLYFQEKDIENIIRDRFDTFDISDITPLSTFESNILYYNDKMVSLLIYLQRVQQQNSRWILLDRNTFTEFLTKDRDVKEASNLIMNKCFSECDEKALKRRFMYNEHISVSNHMDMYSKHTMEILKLGKGHLIIAGGFVTRYCLDQCGELDHNEMINTDVDFFFVGIKENPYQEYQTSPGAIKIIDSVFEYFKNTGEEYIITHSDFAINIVTKNGKMFQFILKLYPRADMVVGSFDLDPCRALIEYGRNGKPEMKCTLSFALSLKTRTYPLDVKNFGTASMGRIIKYRKLDFHGIYPHTTKKKVIRNEDRNPNDLYLDSGIFGEYNRQINNNYKVSDYEGIIHRRHMTSKDFKIIPKQIVEINWLRFFKKEPLIQTLCPKESFEMTKEKMVNYMSECWDINFDPIHDYIQTITTHFLKGNDKCIDPFSSKIFTKISRDTLNSSFKEPLMVFLRNRAVEKLKKLKEDSLSSQIIFKTPNERNIAESFTLLRKSEKEWYGAFYVPLPIGPDKETEKKWLYTFHGMKLNSVPRLIRDKIRRELEMNYVERMTNLILQVM